MKEIFENKNIGKINIVSIIFSAFFAVLLALGIIYNGYREFEKEKIEIIQNYYDSQKESITRETVRALKYIEYKYKTYAKEKTKDELQKIIVDAIENMRNEGDGSGYVFIYTFEGINIADPILKQNAGKNLINFTDPNGKKVISELIEVSKNSGGGFVEYVWNKPIVNKLSPKISYAKAFFPWGWMVGSGVYLDDIENVIAEKKAQFDKKIIKYVLQILTLTILLYSVVAMIYRYMTSLISKDIENLELFFNRATFGYKLFNKDEILFKEFKQIAIYANMMIEKIAQKSEALEELNKTLEQKVEQKTQKLQSSMDYIQDLLKKQDKFIKNAIHEINTPLTIIITNIDLYYFKFEKNRYLTNIEAAVKIIHNIYNDLAYMVKKDRIEYKPQMVDFGSFLRERVDFFQEVALANNLTFIINIENNINIFINETVLQRLCDNNLSNAIKYSNPNSIIKICLTKNSGFGILEVENTGEEIKDGDKIFEMYYREDDVRGGFGIGLNMVKEICDKNNIKIEVESKKEFDDKNNIKININVFRYYIKIVDNF